MLAVNHICNGQNQSQPDQRSEVASPEFRQEVCRPDRTALIDTGYATGEHGIPEAGVPVFSNQDSHIA
jgi:hypothetical protein